MLGLGIHKKDQYLRMGSDRRFAGSRVAYNLLRIDENPSDEDIRVFEDISFTLRTSNGTFRTTFRNRFADVDAACLALMGKLFTAESVLRIEDRAVSHGLTSCEWAKRLLPLFPHTDFEASDLLLQLLELSVDGGEIFITEMDGTPLQYINPPFVVSVIHAESWRNPLRRLVAARAKSRFRNLRLPSGWVGNSQGVGYQFRPIPYIHPEAAALARSDPRFQFRKRSVFEVTPGGCNVLRTMNIFNRSYFSTEQLADGFRAVFGSILPGGLWIAGRTDEEHLANRATFFRRTDTGWEVLDRVRGGWELEEFALGLR